MSQIWDSQIWDAYVCCVVSPFRFGGEVAPDQLVDRVEEVASVTRALSSGERLFLIGPRRFGKTSIITAAVARAREAGVTVIAANAEEYVTPEALAGELIRQGAEQMSGPLERGFGRAARFFRRIRPTVAYDPITDAWTVGVSPDKSGGLDTIAVTEALKGLEAMAQEYDGAVAVVIDEFQQVVAGDGVPGERAIRAVVQRQQRLGYVFAGSATTLLTAMTSDHNRPFYRLGATRHLGPIPREDFRRHLAAGFARIGKRLLGDATEAIFLLAEDVPYSVQRLAHEVWTGSAATAGEAIAATSVTGALDALIATETPTYGRIVSQLTSAQLKALSAVAVASGYYVLTATATARKYGMAVSTLRRSLNALEEKGLLRQDFGTPGVVYWRYEDPFFRAYVRRYLHV